MGGWVRVTASGTANPKEVAPFLAHRLAGWLRESTRLRLVCIVPIDRDGDTVELHAWYEQHIFNDKSSLSSESQGA